MMPKHTGEPDLALVGVALLLILGFMMWQDRPIQSPRPYDSASTQQHDPRIIDHSYESWLWQDPFEFDPAEDQFHNKLHKIFELKETEQQLPTKSLEENNSCFSSNSLLKTEVDKILKKPNEPLKIIVSSVNSRHNTVENREARTRYRYAVITGLIELGYSPAEPNRLHFCATQNTDETNKLPKFDVRWERFSRKNENIIVIWFDGESHINISIKLNPPPRNIFDIEVFNLDPEKGIWFDGSNGRTTQQASSSESSNPHILLPKKLVKELRKRGITDPSEVAIIAERDTKNIRNLATDFCNSFGKSINGVENEKCNSPNNIKNFTYLVGPAKRLRAL